ncbi:MULTISPECIES: Sec-independent protein translocase protein TatB [Lonsdalea]|uniref:Sec-independent translocase n=2 Tax=Lonsdalea TaxID=1082702 RepID=A0ACD1JG37_9GAMM|nr:MULTISPECIES: Sec-independent protein translocase protein TatB [Lonsdalea]OSM97821.1 sec-independent translocase [Lonsdalea populi]OSN01233.1 sec-independent translocase [Lonsdalea populi]QPQ24380.1 Sec-independent protein translocase subunit TatB [Lonsdalea populi]RAT16353.1 sec-independent translocase [Lonsdalea quercina]RAT18380.1 sec-independent translocase [Lonsdalea quercina]
MFDIGFSELLLVMVIGLVVLGPERLPVAVKTVVGWIRALRSLASTVQNELVQEMKLQELKESLKKVEQASNLQNLSPELKASMDELKEAADSMKRTYSLDQLDEETKGGTPGQPLSDPEAAHDGVIEHETAPASPVTVNTVEAQSRTADNNADESGKMKTPSPAATPSSPSQPRDDH